MTQEPEWKDTKQMGWFRLQLVPGSEAADWFEDVTAGDPTKTASISTIKQHFNAQWPPKPRTKKSASDKLEVVLAYKLEEGKMLDVVDGTYAYE